MMMPVSFSTGIGVVHESASRMTAARRCTSRSSTSSDGRKNAIGLSATQYGSLSSICPSLEFAFTACNGAVDNDVTRPPRTTLYAGVNLVHVTQHRDRDDVFARPAA